MIESLSAVTFQVCDMARSVEFYEKIGFQLKYGGKADEFTSFFVGTNFLNLQLIKNSEISLWGRAIFYVQDVDVFFQNALEKDLKPEFDPRNGAWGGALFSYPRPRWS